MSHLPGNHEGHERASSSLSTLLVLFIFLAVVVWTPLTRLVGQAGLVPLPEQAAPDLLAYPWLYLRDSEPLAASEKVVELIAVGDVMLGRGVADKSQPFVAVAPWLGAADLTLGNLECVIAEEGVPRPGLMTPDEAILLLARVQPSHSGQDELPRSERDELTPRRLSFACDGQTCRLVNMPQPLKTGSFRTGAIDLTGDGVAEQVRLEEQQVIIYRNGIETWRGLPEWRVVDLALGDPNDDGRSELLLALWKPDAAGVPRSHPFIIGYREGAYRILWGGSAVADPIREVELGDVDDDGVQELILLEERGDGCAVTVWRWHGWGFSLMWRSPSGRYRDLALIAGGVGHLPIISVAVES